MDKSKVMRCSWHVNMEQMDVRLNGEPYVHNYNFFCGAICGSNSGARWYQRRFSGIEQLFEIIGCTILAFHTLS